MDQRSDKSNDDDEKRAQIHKIFYAELIKLFVIESDSIKKSKLSEVELDQNIILTSEEYYNRNNDIYDVSKKLFMTLFSIDIFQIKYMYVYILCCGGLYKQTQWTTRLRTTIWGTICPMRDLMPQNLAH